jgi:hypothetical protein
MTDSTTTMADDEFDIDIYGDTNTEQDGDFKKDEEGDMKIDGVDPVNGHEPETNGVKHEEEVDDGYVDIKVGNGDQDNKLNEQQKIKSTDESGQDLLTIPKQAPQQQGVKRKDPMIAQLILEPPQPYSSQTCTGGILMMMFGAGSTKHRSKTN